MLMEEEVISLPFKEWKIKYPGKNYEHIYKRIKKELKENVDNP